MVVTDRGTLVIDVSDDPSACTDVFGSLSAIPVSKAL